MTGHRVFLLLMSIAIIAVGGLGWLLGISPMLTAAATASTDAQAVEAENALHEAKVVQLKAQYEALPEARKKLKRLQQVIPDREYLDRVADELTVLAASTSVVIASIVPAEAQAYAVPAPTAAATPAPTSTETPAPTDAATAPPVAPVDPNGVTTHLYTLPLLITVVGPPDNIIAFVNACQLGKRLFVVNSVNITQGTASPASQGTISGFVFVYLDPAAAPYNTPEPTPSPTPTPTPTDTPTPEPTTGTDG